MTFPGGFGTPPLCAETVSATLCYHGVAFAQRPVAVQRAPDATSPLPFSITEPGSSTPRMVHCAATCAVLADPTRANTLLCVPAVPAAPAPRKHPRLEGTALPFVWDVVGVFRAGDAAVAPVITVAGGPAAVLPLLLDAFPDMPPAVRAHFGSLLNLSCPDVEGQEGEGQEEEDPAEQRSLELLEFAEATWRDVAGEQQQQEESLPWEVFVERLCTHPEHGAWADARTVGALRALLCGADARGAVTAGAWARFVCMFCVARPRTAVRDAFAWAEAAALLRQPWFCGPLGAARAGAALARAGRACGEFLVRYSDALWRHGVFVLSRSSPGRDPVHTRLARHCPGDPWLLARGPGGVLRCTPLAARPPVYAATGDRARCADLFYYALPEGEDVEDENDDEGKEAKTPAAAWPTLAALVADLHDHHRAQRLPHPLVPSLGITFYND